MEEEYVRPGPADDNGSPEKECIGEPGSQGKDDDRNEEQLEVGKRFVGSDAHDWCRLGWK
jgi:hypothetical protein